MRRVVLSSLWLLIRRTRSVASFVGRKNEKSSWYSVVCSSFIPVQCNHVLRIIAGRTDAFVPCWNAFKNCTAVETGLLHSHPLTNSHFRFLVTVESAISGMLLQQSVKNVWTAGWMVVPVKRLQQLSCPICAQCGCRGPHVETTSLCIPWKSLTQSLLRCALGVKRVELRGIN